MTVSRIPEEPFNLDDICTYWRVQGAKYTKFSSLSYGLMEIPGPDGESRLARVGPNFSAWFARGSQGSPPDDVDFDVSEKEREAASRWFNAASGPASNRSRHPSTPVSTAEAEVGEAMKTWGVYTWGKSEIDCPHCKWRGRPKMSMVEFDVTFRRGEPAAFHCPACFKDIGFVDFFSFEDALANWDDLSEESRAIALHNAAVDRLRRSPRLVGPAQLPDLEGDELRFTWHLEKGEMGSAIVLSVGDRTVWSQLLGAESEGFNVYSRVASILKERYGARVRDFVPTAEVVVKLAEMDSWVYQDMGWTTPGQIWGTDAAVRRLRRKLFGASGEPEAGVGPGLEELIAGMKPKPMAVANPAWSAAGPWVPERPAQASFPKKGKRGRKRDRDRWQALQAVREDEALQAKHPIAEGKERFGEYPDPCPSCGTPGEQLAWFYFESPPWTWTNLCGRAGWMVVCDHCQRRVASIVTILN